MKISKQNPLEGTADESGSYRRLEGILNSPSRVAYPATLIHWQRDYYAGSGRALHEAIVFCTEHQIPPPDWVMGEIARQSAAALEGKHPTPAKKRQGDTSMAKRRARDIERQRFMGAAIWAAREVSRVSQQHGPERATLKWSAVQKLAAKMLGKVGIDYSPISISDNDAREFSPGEASVFRSMLQLREGYGGYLSAEDQDTPEIMTRVNAIRLLADEYISTIGEVAELDTKALLAITRLERNNAQWAREVIEDCKSYQSDIEDK